MRRSGVMKIRSNYYHVPFTAVVRLNTDRVAAPAAAGIERAAENVVAIGADFARVPLLTGFMGFAMIQPPANSIHPPTLPAWRAWLVANHTRPDGIWLITYRTTTGKATFTYEQAVEEALCFGWIDGQAKRLDDERTLQWYAPRRPGSVWAKSNKARVERLIADGRMTAAGQAKIDAAKADGSWSLLDSVDKLEVPADLAAAFDAYPDARAHFDAFPPSARHASLGWIATAKRPETRAKRVAETARLAQANVRMNQR